MLLYEMKVNFVVECHFLQPSIRRNPPPAAGYVIKPRTFSWNVCVWRRVGARGGGASDGQNEVNNVLISNKHWLTSLLLWLLIAFE